MPLHIVTDCKRIDAVNHVSIRPAYSWALWLAGRLAPFFLGPSVISETSLRKPRRCWWWWWKGENGGRWGQLWWARPGRWIWWAGMGWRRRVAMWQLTTAEGRKTDLKFDSKDTIGWFDGGEIWLAQLKESTPTEKLIYKWKESVRRMNER